MVSENSTAVSVILGFRCCVHEIRALLEFHAASKELFTDWLSRNAGEKLPFYAA